MKRINIAAIAIAAIGAAATAQTAVYLNSTRHPQLTEAVPMADKVTFADGKMTVSGLVERTFGTDTIARASWVDRGAAFDLVLPGSIIDDYTFEIPWHATAAGVDVSEAAPIPDDADFYSAHTFTTRITVTYEGTTARVEGEIPATMEVSVDGANVTVASQSRDVEYILRGSSANGSFKLYSESRACVTLAGVSLRATDRAAINLQSHKRNIINLAAGTDNTLEDSGTYAVIEGEDQKGCLFGEGQLCFNGSGSLHVRGTCKGGIVSDDYIRVLGGFISVEATGVKASAIKAKDDFVLTAGYVQTVATGAAGRGVTAGGNMRFEGGEITAFTTGDVILEDGKDDYTSSSALKCDQDMAIEGSRVNAMSSGTGGKGINCGGNLTIGAPAGKAEPQIRVRTTGRRIPDVKEDNNFTGPAASPKGIKASGNLVINNGKINVNTIGGDGAEGIEAKGDAYMNGGHVVGFCIDDVFNTGGGLYMNDGRILGASLMNDGLDVSFCYYNGGFCYLIGGSGDNTAYDTDGKTFIINGGTLLGAGGTLGGVPDYRQQQCSLNADLRGNYRYLGLRDSAGGYILAMALPEDYPVNKRGFNYSIVMSSPLMKKDTAYTLCGAQSIEGGEETDGLITGATLVNPTEICTFTTTEVNTYISK